MRRSTLSATCLAVGLPAVSAAAGTPVEEAVPQSLISRGRLRISEFGVSLASPSAEWEWRRVRLESQTTYMCQHPPSNSYFMVSGSALEATGEGYIRGFLRAFEGPSIKNLKYQRSAIPVPGSYRVTYEQRHASGALFHVTIYTVPRVPVSVSLSHSSLAPGESPLFTGFVKGCRLEQVLR